MNYTRRDFLKASSGLVGASIIPGVFKNDKEQVKLSFSTLGCPDWSFDKILDFASQHGYSGIEVRGIQHEMFLPKCKEFSAANIPSTLSKMGEKNLQFVDLGSSASLHQKDKTERQKNMDEAKAFIDLAQQINCPYIRVFPNNFPKDQEHDETIQLITEGLNTLGDYAGSTNVAVLMETHGDVVRLDDLKKVMQSVNHKHVGLVWDIVNMWSVTKEAPADVFAALKNYIKHTHIKDLKVVDGKEQYTLLGEGETPIFNAIDILHNAGYNGYYSFEWEKLWHPEIPEPEVALADYPIKMKKHFSKF